MKKIVSVLLMSAMLVTGLSACTSTTTNETTVGNDTTAATTAQGDSTGGAGMTVSWWGNQTRNERTQAAIDLYESENPGISIDGQFSEWNDYWTKMSTASAGKSLPDVMQMDYAYLEMYVGKDQLVDLTPYIDSGALDVSNIADSVLSSGKIGDKLYAIPIGINAPALLYNKTLLDENGIQMKDNMTIDEFLAVCREVYEKTGYKTSFPYGFGENWMEYLLRGNGIQFYEGDAFGVENASDFEQYFELTETGLKEGWHLSPDVYAEIAAGSVEQAPLVYGSSPATMSWCAFYFSNQLTAMQSAAGDAVEIGITTWPSNDPKASNYLKPAQFFSISASDDTNIDEAIKFLDFWTNSEDCNKILLGERGVPASSVIAEAIAPSLTEKEQGVIAYINDVVTPNSSTINPPVSEKAGEIKKALYSAEEKMCYGEITAAQAAQEFYDQGNKIFGK